MTTSESKVCAFCGGSFGCGAKADGCWCVDVSLAPEIADDLKRKYQDCLCPTCLSALFYDERNTLLKQISMSANIEWKLIAPDNSDKKI